MMFASSSKRVVSTGHQARIRDTDQLRALVPFIEVDQSEHIHIREVVTDTTFTHAISVETAADLHVSLVEITG